MMKKNNMGFIIPKKIIILCLLISATLVSTSFAGRVRKSMASKKVSATPEDFGSWEALHHDDEVSEVHERLLKVKTNDYGRYDPAPAFVKPPFKLIPN